MKFSETTPELRVKRLVYIDRRWEQLAGLDKENGQAAINYLLLTNSGSAIAVLSFMGAMKTTTPIPAAPAMLTAFLIGVVLVGALRAILFYHVARRYARWRDGVQKLFADEWTWEELIAHDDAMGWSFWPADFCGWASFACFIYGLWLGLASLP
jgi:hypothetical protein